jgi:predicted amidohydrolase
MFGKKTYNIERALSLMNTRHADLYVLPELFNTGYSFRSKSELRALSEPAAGGETSQALIDYARAAKTAMVAGIAERDGKRLFNSAILVKPDGDVKTYRKTHLFLFEKSLFDRGNGPYAIHTIGNTRVGMLVCFDWMFPEAARELALKGADIIAHPANLVLPYCQAAMVTRAIENRVFAIVANRVGSEHRRKELLRFTGRSEIVSPKGKILGMAGDKEETVVTAEIDVKDARNKKVTPLNDIFKDRRTELYAELRRGRR